MFSGKSEELIRRLRRAQIARQRVQIFKPAVDTRYAEDHIVSHSELRIPSEQAHGSADLVVKVRADTEVVGIDEGQFFDAGLPAACTRAGGARRPRDRRRARSGLSRQAVRADAAAAGDRRIHHQDARDLHGVRQPRQSHAASGAEQRPRPARRHGHLRGALPALLRSHAVVGAAGRDAGRRAHEARRAAGADSAGCLAPGFSSRTCASDSS